MIAVPKLTRGRLTALWVVLRSALKLGSAADREELISFARKSGLRAGGLPISDGYKLAVLGNFIDDEKPSISDLGRDALSRCSEEEPSPEVVRLFLSVFLLRYPPGWVAYWQGDSTSLDIVLPDSAKEILNYSGIESEPTPIDLEAWALWAALRTVPQPEETAQQRKIVGTAAEQLSYVYEQNRLAKEGYGHLASRVRWVARESPAYGFDILSFCGCTTLGLAPEARIAIEVKAQSLVARPNFTFFLTRHEWHTAKSLPADIYSFHFWHGVNTNLPHRAAHDVPITIKPSTIDSHIPLRPKCSCKCDWESTVIVLDLSTVAS